MIPRAAAAFLFPVVAIPLAAWSRRKGASWATVGARVLLAGAALLVAAFTILPVPLDGSTERVGFFPTLLPFRTIGSYLKEGLVAAEARQLLGNVALFMPLGFALPLALPRARRAIPAIALGAVVSLGVEVAQIVIPEHGPDIDDVILNTLGVAIGFAGYASLRLLSPAARGPDARPRPRP